jgi:heptosyltransferase-1
MFKNPKILIIRLSSIGDIFHTMTVLNDIKQYYPSAQIDWLVDQSFVEVAQLSPLINKVIAIPLRAWKKSKLTWFIKLWNFKRNLAKIDYDYIIDSQGLLKSAFLSRFLFQGKVYGLDFKSAREGLASCFYHCRYSVAQNDVAVPRLRGLVQQIFDLEIANVREFELEIRRENCQINYPDGYIVFLHGTSKQNKKWSLANWHQLSLWLLENTKQQIIITYSNASELGFAQQLINHVANPRIKLIDKLSFIKLSDLIQGADLVIGVDTGFTHLANLTKRPTIAIYLHSRPDYVGMLESEIAYNLGGYNCQVSPELVIECIQKNNLFTTL